MNKTESRVEVFLPLTEELFTPEEITLIKENLSNKITAANELHVYSQVERSQLLNKKRALANLTKLIAGALTPQKPRKATKPSKSSIRKRLVEKKKQSEKKLARQKHSGKPD